MRIAFVGKWGSGKTTLTASLVRFLRSKKLFTLVVDADINVWLASSIGIDSEKWVYLSDRSKVEDIRKYLIGTNTHISSVWLFVKTTPPGNWSRLITRDSEDFFDLFCSYQDQNLKFLHVGTYEGSEIWISCYHTHLSIFENILSHTFLRDNEFLIADMVAWNDAFSNTLYAQFDILCLIVEPTLESVNMVRGYQELMKQSGSTTQIVLIANKIEDKNDTEYLKKNNIIPDFVFEYERHIKHARQNNEIFLSEHQSQIWEDFYKFLKKLQINPDKKLQELHIIHKKYMELDYIKSPLWDLWNQIDTTFHFSWK